MADRVSWEIIASLWLHISLGAVLILGERCTPSAEDPLFNPDDVMRVSICLLYTSPSPRDDR